MKVIAEGLVYELKSFDNPEAGQVLQFIHKEPAAEGSAELITIHDGTTNEEVLAVLIDRMYSLQKKSPCRENSIVITKLEESLMWLEKRTSDRKSRGVEGKMVK